MDKSYRIIPKEAQLNIKAVDNTSKFKLMFKIAVRTITPMDDF